MNLAPVQLIVIEFDRENGVDAVIREFFSLRQKDTIRLLDLAVVTKDATGSVKIGETSDLTASGAKQLGALVGGLIGLGAAGKTGAVAGAVAGIQASQETHFGISEAQLRTLLDDLPHDSSAVIALIEHYWYSQVKEKASKAGAVFFKQGMVTPAALMGLGVELSATRA